MICYKDRTFCPFEGCKHFYICKEALTEEVKQKAYKWWGTEDAPISRMTDKPNCYQEAK